MCERKEMGLIRGVHKGIRLDLVMPGKATNPKRYYVWQLFRWIDPLALRATRLNVVPMRPWLGMPVIQQLENGVFRRLQKREAHRQMKPLRVSLQEPDHVQQRLADN